MVLCKFCRNIRCSDACTLAAFVSRDSNLFVITKLQRKNIRLRKCRTSVDFNYSPRYLSSVIHADLCRVVDDAIN